VKHLQYRVKLQYRKLSPEKIRQHLINVQTSILLDTKKRIRYGLPSRMSQEARKIVYYLILKKGFVMDCPPECLRKPGKSIKYRQ